MALGETAQLAVNLNLTGNFNKDIGKATASLKGVATQTKSLSSQIKGSVLTGVGLGAGVTGFTLLANGISSVIDFGTDAIGMASDLAESQSKVNVVFAEGADEVLDWGKTAATAMGLSEQAALEAAGTFGNFIQALGNSREEAQRMSMDIVELAGDLASFNNTDINEVIIALRSGLAGEAEPMRRLGVSISATRVEANILAKGIARTKEEITDAMKVSERYAIIMEDTALAQGDFARTSDGLANSQRILSAQMANLQTAFGTMLLPHLTNTVNLFQDLVDIIDGPDGVSKAMDTYIDRQRELKGLTDETAQATKEWQSGLGSLEDSFADTIAGDFAPHMREAVLLWREFGEELSRNGDSFNEWESAFFKAKNELGLTSDAALQLTLDLVNQDRAVRAAVSSVQLWSIHMHGASLETEDAADGAHRAARSFKALAFETLDMAAATGIAVRGFKDEKEQLNDLIKRANKLGESRDKTGERLADLTRQEKRLLAEQSRAAEQNRGAQVAALQAAIEKNRDMQASLRATLRLLQRVKDIDIVVDIGSRVSGPLARFGGGLFSGAGGGRDTGPNWSGGIIPPGSWGTVGERGTERIRNVGGVAVVEPMSQSSGNRTEIIVQTRPVITAFMVGRELGRAATTRRSGAGVL